MSDYVSRQYLLDEYDCQHKGPPGGARKIIAEAPAADVVPVVRCENCVHWSDSNQCERPELTGNRWHDDKYFETLPDDFCSYGERKED